MEALLGILESHFGGILRGVLKVIPGAILEPFEEILDDRFIDYSRSFKWFLRVISVVI